MDPTRGVGGSCADGLNRPKELPPTDETINRAEEATIRRSVARAIQGAKSRGYGVGDWVGEWADVELAPPKVDWRDLLRNAIESAIQYQRGNLEYTWSRLSRRQAASPDFLLPGMHSPIPEVAVVLDTSSSMFTAAYGKAGKDAAYEGAKFVTLLQEALHEIGGILEEYGNTIGVNVLATDTVVQSAQRVYDIEDIQLLGGGGTDMGVGLDALALLEPQPNVAICLTDGYTPWPEEHPEVDAEYIVGIVGATEAELAQSWPPPAWADETIYIDEL
jgi:predicted metal-dependent peptidase